MAVDFGSVGGVALYPNGHFAMSEKSFLRWIDAAQVQDVVSSGVYRVYRFDHANAGAPGNKLGLRCSNGNGDVIWAGLRQNFAETAGKATILWSFRDNQHRILDTTPLSATGQTLPTDRQDGALAVGQTWVDPTQTLRITNLGGGGSSPNEYLDLQVSIVEVPSMEFFTTAGEITRGLTGSYVNANLRGSTDTDWTDGSQTISGARVDNPVKFLDRSWGSRAAVGLTGGTDADWDDFSVQWDGYVRVRRRLLLATISDDSSRMWIDRDGNGTFSAGELVNNNWGNSQGTVLGDLSPVLEPGLYRIRVQYEEGEAGNSFQFGTNEFLFEAYTDTTFATRGLSAAYINSKLNGSTDLNWVDGSQTIAGRRVEYPFFTGTDFGNRASVGITGGTAADWNNFSVQWDGVLLMGRVPMRFGTIADDGSRLWIDVAGDLVYDNALPDFVENQFSNGGAANIGSLNGPVVDGGFKFIRVQYWDGLDENSIRLVGIPSEPSDDHGSTDTFATLLPGTNSQLRGKIEVSGDKDVFRIQLPGPGRLRAWTLGGIDTFGTLRNASGGIVTTADDVNGSYNRNFEIDTELPAGGSYYIEVRGFNAGVLGDYGIVTEFYPGTPIGPAIEQGGVTFEPGQNRLITPSSVTQTAGDAITPGFQPQNLINNSGLSAVPASNASNYRTITHTAGFASGTWATASGNVPNYFDIALPAPQFVFNLGATFDLSALVIWGYAGINNEASDFTVEFSEDGGATYRRSRAVQTTSLVGTGVATLDFGPILRANTVRVTITSNAGRRGFAGAGAGDRVGLSEIKFLGTATFQPWRGQTDLTLDGRDAIRSGTIGDSQESSFQWNVTGPGVLSWWWKVSSEGTFDPLEFHLDGVLQFTISGEVDWQLRRVTIPAGSHTVMWRYRKDGSLAQGADAGWLDQLSFRPDDTTALDAPSLTLVNGGNANWFAQTAITRDGVDAMQSGDIADGQASTLQTTIEGPAWVSFSWKVSSEPGFDPLVFHVNGSEQSRISGETDWQPMTAILPVGPQTIRWEYSKDSSLSAGADAGWVDEVVISDPSLRPQIIPGPGGGRRLRFTSQPGSTYALDHSPELAVWTRILSEIPSGGTETVIDIPAPLARQPAGFFRLGR